jgi:hypothetical protein
MIERKEDWPEQLNELLEGARHREFERGIHDCALFACDAVFFMTGVDFGEDLRGTYSTKKAAFEAVKKIGCKDLIALATKRLGEPLKSVSMAGRGDIIAVKYGDELGLAVVDLTGRRAVTPGLKELQYYPPQYWLKAWKV